MENQHRKIKGYRELSQAEIDLMNEVKEKGAELGDLVAKVQAYLKQQHADAGSESTLDPQRWAAIAKTDLQTGLMALTRSIAQPGFF